jgi:hypothetical protein
MVGTHTFSCIATVAALSLCAEIGQLSAPASAASSPARRPTSIVLHSPAPPNPFEDLPTHLSGRLRPERADRLVVLQRRGAHGWQDLARTRTDEAGRYAITITPRNPGPVELRAVHPSHRHRAVSSAQRLDVLDRRVFLATRASYRAFDPIVLSGTLRPRTPHQYVALQRLLDGRWLPVHAGYTDSEGRYAISMPSTRPGAWTVRAYWPGRYPAGGTREYSYGHRYTVRADLDPVVTRVTRDQLGGSYHDGCPVGPALLRNLTMTFHTFGPFVDRGTLVVRATIVEEMVQVFGQALANGYPIRRMLPTAHYGGSDVRSMNHDNTSAFNCRHVTGDPTRLSPHSYGTALDIDTVENPYQDVTGTWWPKAIGQEYRDRSQARPGMLYAGSRVTKDLNARGFQWGGRWSHPDYQHFDTNADKIREPARRAGPLSAASLPRASEIGRGWLPLADARIGDEGQLRNGAFAQRRTGRNAAAGVLPRGCRTPYQAPLASPRFALQGSYLSSDGRRAQAVVMQFSTEGGAAVFLRQLRGALQACVAPDGPAGLAVRVLSGSETSYRVVRQYATGDRWHEHDWRTGRQVTVLLTQALPPNSHGGRG